MPPAQKYRQILWGKDIDLIMGTLETTKIEYDNRPVKDKTLMLVEAVFSNNNDPANILPMTGFSLQSYQIFLFSEKLMNVSNIVEADSIISEMRKAEDNLNDIDFLEAGGVKKYFEKYKNLCAVGLDYLDEFLIHYGFFDLDEGEMNARQLFLCGMANISKNNLDEAMKYLSSAIKLEPNQAVCYYNRGVIYGMKGQDDLALKDYSKAIKLNPSYYNALCNRGLIYAQTGHHDKALKDFNRAVEVQPNTSFAYCNRGNLMALLDEHERAIEDFTAAINIDPDIAYLYCNRGISFHQLGKEDRAVEDLEKSAGMGFDKAKKALEEIYGKGDQEMKDGIAELSYDDIDYDPKMIKDDRPPMTTEECARLTEVMYGNKKGSEKGGKEKNAEKKGGKE
jgi:tetratricopeptide (TPR) repeat protein